MSKRVRQWTHKQNRSEKSALHSHDMENDDNILLLFELTVVSFNDIQLLHAIRLLKKALFGDVETIFSLSFFSWSFVHNTTKENISTSFGLRCFPHNIKQIKQRPEMLFRHYLCVSYFIHALSSIGLKFLHSA